MNPSHLAVDKAYVEEVHHLGMGCFVWAVNRSPAMKRTLRMGVDGVITNRPRLLDQLLARRLSSTRALRLSVRDLRMPV